MSCFVSIFVNGFDSFSGQVLVLFGSTLDVGYQFAGTGGENPIIIHHRPGEALPSISVTNRMNVMLAKLFGLVLIAFLALGPFLDAFIDLVQIVWELHFIFDFYRSEPAKLIVTTPENFLQLEFVVDVSKTAHRIQ